jgi:parallel beta-helix repeat protein
MQINFTGYHVMTFYDVHVEDGLITIQDFPLQRLPIMVTTIVDDPVDPPINSLRWAINQANSNSGLDSIHFDLDGPGPPYEITVLDVFPEITDAVIIDGTTQAGYIDNPVIILVNEPPFLSINGFEISAGNCTIRGLEFYRLVYAIYIFNAGNNIVQNNTFRGWYDGVRIENSSNNLIGGEYGVSGNYFAENEQCITIIGNAANNNYIQGNIIGPVTEPLSNNHNGIYIVNAPNNVIGGTLPEHRNVISKHDHNGILITGADASGNVIQGNYIGTDLTGDAALFNRQSGIYIDDAPNNTIGGSIPGVENVISGNEENGIVITGILATGNTVQGNLIGTNSLGTLGLGNSQAGILINSPDNIVGGVAPGEGNLIADNELGVVLQGPDADNNRVIGNYIGTTGNGLDALGNTFHGMFIGEGSGNIIGPGNIISGNGSEGILLIDQTNGNNIHGNLIGTNVTGDSDIPNALTGIKVLGASYNLIGGDLPGEGNVISGNLEGILIVSSLSTGNQIKGNYIGTDISGTQPLGNTGNGVRFGLQDGVSDYNTVGGVLPGAGNVIAYNGEAGVVVRGGIGQTISGNSIYSNGTLGIDLNNDGVTSNDRWDADVGPNDLQNYPILTYADTDSAVVRGTLNGRSNWRYRIEFFNNTSSDASSFGEGETYLGEMAVETGDSGTVGFTHYFGGSFLPGEFITATATEDSVTFSTSEFSKGILTGVSSRIYGDHYIINTTDSGIPLHWPKGKGNYVVSNTTPAGYQALVETGFTVWSASCPEIDYQVPDPSGRVVDDATWGGEPDGLNNNVWFTSNWQSTGMDEGVVSITRIRYNAITGEMTDVDIAYNAQDMQWSSETAGEADKMDVLNVVTHEAGHFWGLGDLFNPGHARYVQEMGDGNNEQTMYGFIAEEEIRKRDLNLGDIAGIAYLYSHLPEADIDLVLVFEGADTYVNDLVAFEASKRSAVELVDQMRIGDRLAVYRMPSDVIVSLTEIDETNRETIKTDIATMASGGSAAIGTGLQTAYDILEGAVNSASRRWEVILFSSGEEETTEPLVLDVLPGIAESKTHIHTIGFAGTVSYATDLLSYVAEQTNGGYYFADDTTQIGDIVSVIWYQMLGIQLLFEKVGSTENLGPGIRWQGAVISDEGTASLLPGIRWQGSDLDLTLFDPNGIKIDHSNYTNYEASEVELVEGATYEYYRIANPLAGQWELYVSMPVAPDSPEPYTLYVLGITDVTMDVYFDKDRYESGEVIQMTAKINAGGESITDEHVIGGDPVTDAEVLARYPIPGTTDTLDINLTHIGDGIYTGLFNDTAIEGNYEFIIQAQKTGVFTRKMYKTVYISKSGTGVPPEAQLLAIQNRILNNLDDVDLKKPAGSRIKTFVKKLEVILKLIINENYQEAKDKLEEDILVKMDGYFYGDPEDDWIVTQVKQELIYPMVRNLIQDLEGLLQKPNWDTDKVFSPSPDKFEISQNYPNPFNPSTTIRYQLAKDSEVTLKVYNLLGQVVKTLVDDYQSSGYYQVMWDRKNDVGIDVSSGVYFYHFQSGDFSQVRKMILVQ